MPSRTIVEWRCDRCGDEQAIEQHKAHGWRMLVGLMDHTGNPRSNRPEPPAGGDICAECVASYLAWWVKPREHALVDAD